MDGVVLQRVKLRGPAHAVEAARAPLKTALEQHDWPATRPGEWLFLRRIACRGNVRELAARAAQEARRLSDDAVDGWSPAAPDSLAVRFADEASLIACLIRDLLQGSAAHRWYWQQRQELLRRAPGEAVLALLQETPLRVPTVLAHLRHTPVWRSFWQTLDSTAGEQLLAAVACTAGWSVTLRSARAVLAGQQAATAAPMAANDARWQPDALDFLGVTPDDPRPLLAALITLWRHAPAVLTQPAGAAQLAQMARVAAGHSAQSFVRPQARNTAHADARGSALSAAANSTSAAKETPGAFPTDPHAQQPMASQQIAGETEFSEAKTSALAAGKPTFDPGAVPETIPDTLNDQNDAPPAATQQREENEHIAVQPPERATYPHERFAHDFTTAQGGLFYLLNFFRLPAVQKTLGSDVSGAGWRWLYDLAVALDCPPDGALLEFLAVEGGFTDGTALQREPPSIDAGPLLRLGAGRYGDAVWQAATWRFPARLIATPSHVDVHFRLADVRLLVRRAGLDVNPGWLPWLGRVVTFHYGSGLEPAFNRG